MSLIATRVVFSVFAFAVQLDRLYVMLTRGVLVWGQFFAEGQGWKKLLIRGIHTSSRTRMVHQGLRRLSQGGDRLLAADRGEVVQELGQRVASAEVIEEVL